MATIQNILRTGRGIEMRPAAVYALSNAISKSVSFLLLFYFACTLSTSDFGRLSIFNSTVLLLAPFVSMGITESVNKAYFKKDKKAFSHFFSSTLMMPMLATLLCMIVFFAISSKLENHYSFPAVLVAMIPLTAFFRFLNRHLLSIIRNSGDASKHLFISIGAALAEITLAGFFIGAMDAGWQGSAVAVFISCMMLAMYAFFYFKDEGFMVNSCSKKIIREEVRNSISLPAMQYALFCIGPAAVYFVEYFTHDIAEAGVFGIATVFSSAIVVLCTIAMQHVCPKVQALLSQKATDNAALRWQFLFFAGAMLLGTGLVIIAIPLVYNMALSTSCHDGLYYYIFICLGNFFCSISYFLYACFLHNKEKRKAFSISVMAVFISIASHSFFTKSWAAYGAAASVCIVSFVVMATIALMAKKQLTPVIFSKPIEAF